MKILCANPQEQFNHYEKQIRKAIDDVLNSGNYINGSQVKGLEEDFANFNDSDFCLGVSSGTSALEMVLRSQKFEKGMEVITVSHTAIPTVSAIKLANLKPVLIDIDEDTYTMCPVELEKAISSKTRAVVVVHLYGQAANMDAITAICEKYDLILIEDCSQAHGARWRGKRVGNFGIAGCFSCYPTKNLGAIGDAGLICTNSHNLYEELRSIREYGWNSNRLSIGDGGNYRIDEMQAAILRIKLKNLDAMNQSRADIARRYSSSLPKYCTIPYTNEHASHVYHLYVIKVSSRDNLIKHFNSNNIYPGIHYPLPVHQHPFFRHEKKHSMTVTESLLKYPIIANVS